MTEGERPPLLGRWSRLYLLVIANLALTIALLAWLTSSQR